ncbi:hypothetical protein [Enterovibrio norvegicus]|uniref:hypothetical protein n=1 Tax=Enterovibrio norvegicus TaxID=188144 RepID=UPI00352D4699
MSEKKSSIRTLLIVKNIPSLLQDGGHSFDTSSVSHIRRLVEIGAIALSMDDGSLLKQVLSFQLKEESILHLSTRLSVNPRKMPHTHKYILQSDSRQLDLAQCYLAGVIETSDLLFKDKPNPRSEFNVPVTDSLHVNTTDIPVNNPTDNISKADDEVFVSDDELLDTDLAACFIVSQ